MIGMIVTTHKRGFILIRHSQLLRSAHQLPKPTSHPGEASLSKLAAAPFGSHPNKLVHFNFTCVCGSCIELIRV